MSWRIQVINLGFVIFHVNSFRLQIFSFMSQLRHKRTPTRNMTWFMHVKMRRDGRLHILAISAILADNQSLLSQEHRLLGSQLVTSGALLTFAGSGSRETQWGGEGMFVSHDVRLHVMLIDTPIAWAEWQEHEETGSSHEQITVKALKLCSCNAVRIRYIGCITVCIVQ